MNKKLKTGTLVQLKSGGPEMTVCEYVSDMDSETRITCHYFIGGKLEEVTFSQDQLDVINEE